VLQNQNIIIHVGGQQRALIPPTEMVDFGIYIHIGVGSIVPPSESNVSVDAPRTVPSAISK